MTQDIPNKVCPKCGGTLWSIQSKILSNGTTAFYTGNCITCLKISRDNLDDNYVRQTAAGYFKKNCKDITPEEFENQKNRMISHRLAKANGCKLKVITNNLADYYNKNKEEILSAMSTPKTSVEQYEALAAIDEAKVEISSTSEIGMMIQKLMKMEKKREEVYSHLKAINELLI